MNNGFVDAHFIQSHLAYEALFENVEIMLLLGRRDTKRTGHLSCESLAHARGSLPGNFVRMSDEGWKMMTFALTMVYVSNSLSYI